VASGDGQNGDAAAYAKRESEEAMTATPSELPGLPEEPHYLKQLRTLTGAKTTALNEALAYIDALRSRLVEQGEEIEAALKLLNPVSPDETLLGAIKNVLQAKQTAIENYQFMVNRAERAESASGDRHFKLRIEAELRADRAESALREARETEREMCIKKCDEIWAAENMSKHVSQSACQAARSAISKCMMAIRSMT
jgi:hypothetical protein